MDKPNIFDFATSELSQDAFFTWLSNWVSPQYRETPLHDCAVDFIKLLLPNDLRLTSIESVETYNQWKKIVSTAS